MEFSFQNFWESVGANCILRHGLLEMEAVETSEGGEEESSSRWVYVIDIDFNSRLPPKGDKPDVFEIIEKFSEQAGRLFRCCITDELHTALIPSEAQG